MTITRPKLCHSRFALLAIVGAFLASGSASASCTMATKVEACPPVCNCCQTPAPGDSATTVTASTALYEQLPIQAGAVRQEAAGCQCRLQAPTAPEPKPGQGPRLERSDPGRELSAGILEFDDEPRSIPFVSSPRIRPQRKLPIYLRNARLLI